MNPKDFPELDKVLIDCLNDRFPERCASLNETERQTYFYAGQRELVRLLNSVYEEQNRVTWDDEV